MLAWFRALLPKEERFFGLFEQHAALVVAGTESLRAALEGGSALPRTGGNLALHSDAAAMVKTGIRLWAHSERRDRTSGRS